MRAALFAALLVGATVGGDNIPNTDQRCQAYLPAAERLHNTGGSDGPRGPGSGSGLCVFTSVEHCGRQQHIRVLRGFQQWMTRRPGGGWPEKVDAMLAAYGKEKKVAVPRYLQVVETDLTILRAALHSGRMVCVTYGWSPSGRYGGLTIAHMVNLVHADEKWWAILDNNYEDKLEWLSEKEFVQAFTKKGRERGWAIIFYDPPPPSGPFHN